jgi:hypothetical protein
MFARSPPKELDFMKTRTEVSDKMCAEFGEDTHGGVGRRVAGVAGKTIKWMTCELNEIGQPEIDIQCEDGEALRIAWSVTYKVVGEWRRPEGGLGDLEPIPTRKIFE